MINSAYLESLSPDGFGSSHNHPPWYHAGGLRVPGSGACTKQFIKLYYSLFFKACMDQDLHIHLYLPKPQSAASPYLAALRLF